MLEWLKRHAWKACSRQKRHGGSNPPLSAERMQKHPLFSFLPVWQEQHPDVAAAARACSCKQRTRTGYDRSAATEKSGRTIRSARAPAASGTGKDAPRAANPQSEYVQHSNHPDVAAAARACSCKQRTRTGCGRSAATEKSGRTIRSARAPAASGTGKDAPRAANPLHY